ncbi:DUF4286 family protein [Lysobacter koreensis]|uniref:DUF4286 family protein n=1 Tax=Lysobacter koreensis TaxID=266122 RepID=A0ABW2YK43_9GAMM
MNGALREAARDAVVYEVNLAIDAEIADAYRAWLATHMQEICALPGFTGARVFAVQEPAPDAGRIGLCVQYTLLDQAALDAYLRDHAPRLRAEGMARFGGRFTATRRVLHALG